MPKGAWPRAHRDPCTTAYSDPCGAWLSFHYKIPRAAAYNKSLEGVIAVEICSGLREHRLRGVHCPVFRAGGSRPLVVCKDRELGLDHSRDGNHPASFPELSAQHQQEAWYSQPVRGFDAGHAVRLHLRPREESLGLRDEDQ